MPPTVLRTFIGHLRKATDQAALREAMNGMVDGYGLTGFTYVGSLTPRPRLPPYITTYPEPWVLHYLSQRYHEIDPVLIQAQRESAPFLWDCQKTSAVASAEQQRFFDEAAEFGIDRGLTFPLHTGDGDVAVLSFFSDQNRNALRSVFEKHRHVLHIAAMYFHANARHNLERAGECNASLLSADDAACLRWVAYGKSMREIGGILYLSRQRVARHLAVAKRKLKATTLPQAVAAALRDRLIE
jgi:LuxR family transcriptional regulator, activator of conjugal transfer of Ti plasmids